MRIVRPGSVVGPQQQYMYTKQIQWAQWAAVDEFRRNTQSPALVTTTEIVTPVTPPAEVDEDENMDTDVPNAVIGTIPIIMPTTPPPKVLPPVTPHRHIAMAAARAKAISPPGQPRKTPAGKRSSTVLDSDDDDADEDQDVLPALGVAPAASRPMRPKPTSRPLGSRVTASEQRPTRVTRSTAAAAANNRRPGTAIRSATSMATTRTTRAHPNGQAPSKVPRLANGTTARGTVAAASAANTPAATTRRLRRPASPSASRLPTLIPKRGNQNTQPARDGGVAKGGWISNNSAAVVVPRTKTERPALRPTRRRRSSFSSVDVVA